MAFLGNYTGIHAPGWEDLGLALQVAHHVLYSHGLAVPAIRAASPNAQVGITLNFSPAYPASESPEDVAAARRHDGQANRWFTDPLSRGEYPADMWDLYGQLVPRVAPGDMDVFRRPIDFLGVNYYTRAVIRHGRGRTSTMRRSARSEYRDGGGHPGRSPTSSCGSTRTIPGLALHHRERRRLPGHPTAEGGATRRAPHAIACT